MSVLDLLRPISGAAKRYGLPWFIGARAGNVGGGALGYMTAEEDAGDAEKWMRAGLGAALGGPVGATALAGPRIGADVMHVLRAGARGEDVGGVIGRLFVDANKKAAPIADAATPPPAARWQAAVRDPDTGEIYVGANHGDAVLNAPEARQDALYSAIDANPQLSGWLSSGRFLSREDGLAEMGAAATRNTPAETPALPRRVLNVTQQRGRAAGEVGRVYVNPTRADLMRETRVPMHARDRGFEYTGLRYLLDRDGNLFVGPSYTMVHDDIARAIDKEGLLGPGYTFEGPDVGRYRDSTGSGIVERGVINREGDVLRIDADQRFFDDADFRRAMARDGRKRWGEPNATPAAAPRSAGEGGVLSAIAGGVGGAGLGAVLNSEAQAAAGAPEDGGVLLPLLGAGAGAALLGARGMRSVVGMAGGAPKRFWSAAEKARGQRMADEGRTLRDIGQALNRAPGNVSKHIDMPRPSGRAPQAPSAPGAAAQVNLKRSSTARRNEGRTPNERPATTVKNWTRVLDAAENLARENGGQLPARYTDILARRTPYGAESIKSVLSYIRKGQAGPELAARAGRLSGQTGAAAVNRTFVEAMMDRGFDHKPQIILARLNAKRQAQGLEPTSLTSVMATMSGVRKRRREGGDLAALALAGGGLSAGGVLAALRDREGERA